MNACAHKYMQDKGLSEKTQIEGAEAFADKKTPKDSYDIESAWERAVAGVQHLVEDRL